MELRSADLMKIEGMEMVEDVFIREMVAAEMRE